MIDPEDKAQEAEEKGDFTSALNLWRELAQRDGDPILFTRLGRAAQRLERWDESERAFAEALRLDPNFTMAMVCIGDLWAARTDKGNDESFPVARGWFLRALRRERSAQTLILLGAMYRAWGDNLSAREALVEALQLDPSNAEALYNLALAEAETGREKAIELMERAIEVHPTYFAAHQELGKLYHGAGDLPRAEYHFRRSLEVKPSDLWSLLYLANALAVQGKSAEAEETYRLASSLHAGNKDVAEFFADFLETIGKKDEAAAVRDSTG
jgi:tetratricopeptide (TPR) repeat protein